jgi:hypothetical protein
MSVFAGLITFAQPPKATNRRLRKSSDVMACDALLWRIAGSCVERSFEGGVGGNQSGRFQAIKQKSK